jgi:proteasome lid subunit RPN8/RPN11
VNRTTDLNDPAHPSHRNHLIPTNGRTARRIWTNPIDEEIRELLLAGCRSSDKERCGFVTEDQDIWYIDNIHDEPYNNFLMDSDDVEKVVTEIYDIRQTKIFAMFHTHPNGVPWPSPRDLVGWPNPDLKWRYWIVTKTEVIEWQLR